MTPYFTIFAWNDTENNFSMGTHEIKFQSQRNFAISRIKFNYPIHIISTFKVFYTKLNICFWHLALLENDFFKKLMSSKKKFILTPTSFFKNQSHRSLQYSVNNLGTKILSTCYSNVW